VESRESRGSRFIFDVCLGYSPRSETAAIPEDLTQAHMPDVGGIRINHGAVSDRPGASVETSAGSADILISERLMGVHVLLVEDNAINRRIIAEMLEDARIRVTAVEDGRQAILAVDAEEYDAVLMDIQMPGMDGYETTRIIRTNPRHRTLPIIALTAHAMEGFRKKCMEAGMDDYMTKPIDYHQLYAKLAVYTGSTAPMVAPEKSFESRPENNVPCGLASFPGVDVASGLKRMGGRRELYVSVIREFHKDYCDAPEWLAKALKNGEREVIHRIAHTIKGLAANIGANNLQSAAENIEALCNTQDSLPSIPDLDEFNNQLREFLSVSEKIEACLANNNR
jgi:CheY-like chemotaxis protein/HPt (histidine-containing phosphotransfer) domain-containing protein